jgi:HSP20 family protein
MSFLTRFERWDPFDELTTLRNRMDRLMAHVGGQTDEELLPSQWAPTADVVETKNAIVIKAELPGMTDKDISVEIENSVLTMRGERKFEKDTEEKGYRRIERSYGNFVRSFTLPPNVDGDKITASFNNGLLELEIPKKEEAKPRAIKVDVDVKKKLSAAA